MLSALTLAAAALLAQVGQPPPPPPPPRVPGGHSPPADHHLAAPARLPQVGQPPPPAPPPGVPGGYSPPAYYQPAPQPSGWTWQNGAGCVGGVLAALGLPRPAVPAEDLARLLLQHPLELERP